VPIFKCVKDHRYKEHDYKEYTVIRSPFTIPVTMYCVQMSTAIRNYQYVINNLVKNVSFCQIAINLCFLS
jgi:hypothetical protein